MPIFESYEDIGKYLRECRESMKVPIHQASKDLNIRQKYITALEDGRVIELPSGIYAKGYVQRYAQYLRLNEQEILAAFDLLSGKVKADKFYVPEPTRKHNMPTPHILIASSVVLIFAYAVWTFFGNSPASIEQNIQTLPERYARLIDPTQLPQYIADERWRDCFTPLLATNAACQSFAFIDNAPDLRITFLKQNQLFSSNLKLVIERE